MYANDSALAATNDNATDCRYSCYKKGYINDPYVEWFANCPIKSPLINRGTYLRTKAVDEIVLSFLKKNKDGQILSFGAGFDTRYFRLGLSCKYVEIDKIEVIMEKLNKLRRHLKSLKLPNSQLKSSGLTSDTLEIRAADVLELDQDNLEILVDFKHPTLVIAECLFVYLDPIKVDLLITQLFKRKAEIVVYDPLDNGDGFSHQMVSNLNVYSHLT